MTPEALILTLLYLIIPGVLVARLLPKPSLFSSSILQLIAPWLLGHIASSLIIFFLACALTVITYGVLAKATIITLLVGSLALFVMGITPLVLPSRKACGTIALTLLLSFPIFSVHLTSQNDGIWGSPIYWDFPCHMISVQGFAKGDNFPPQMESFAGVFQTYHFLSNLPMGIISSLGVNPADAITAYSVICFGLLLAAIIGICDELFNSFTAGVLAICLSLTSSSFRIFHFLMRQDWSDPIRALQDIWLNNGHPFTFSFETGSPYGYAGVMFNLFYFIEERQLLAPLILFVLAPLVFARMHCLSKSGAVALGALLGSFFLWHIYITIAVGASLLFFLPTSKDKRAILTCLITAGVVVAPQAFLLMSTTSGAEFLPATHDVPRLNVSFSADTVRNYPFSLSNAVAFYLYGLGLKIVTAVAGFLILRRTNTKAAYALGVVALTTFILTNSVQLASNSVHENHKWFRPMLLIFDILSAGALIALVRKRQILFQVGTGILMCLLTFSGILEAIPFLRAKPTELWITYPPEFETSIWQHSAPQDVFATHFAQNVNFAGRRVFVAQSNDWRGNNFNYSLIINNEPRLQQQDELFASTSRAELCARAQQINVHIVEVDDFLARQLRSEVPVDAFFTAFRDGNYPVLFFKTRIGCRGLEMPLG